MYTSYEKGMRLCHFHVYRDALNFATVKDYQTTKAVKKIDYVLITIPVWYF